MADIKFIDGLIVKAPNERAPDYVKAKLSIKRQKLIDWLQAQDGEWINAEVKESQNGKWYAAVDDWKPEGGRRTGAPAPQRQSPQPAAAKPATAVGNDFADDGIPF